MGAAAAWVLATVWWAVPNLAAYPGSRPEAPPMVRTDPDGRRAEVSRLATRDPLDVVRRRLVDELGAGRVLSEAREGARRVIFVGPTPAEPLVVAWRDDGEAETHLLVRRHLGYARVAAEPAVTSLSRLPRPGGTILGVPAYPPGATAATAMVGSEREGVLSYEVDAPWEEVAAFYLFHLSTGIEAHEAGTDWLEASSAGRGGPSVQVLRAAGSGSTRITIRSPTEKPPPR